MLLLATLSEGIKISIIQECLQTHVFCNTVHNNKDKEPAMMPGNRWVDKENVLLSYMEEQNSINCRKTWI